MSAEDSTTEKRNHRRRRVLKVGTIAFGGSTIDCVIRNISASGAALEVASQLGIPASFHLVIASEQLRKQCRVLWRKADRLGVAFDEP